MVWSIWRRKGKHISEYDRTKWVAHYEVAEPMIAVGLPLVVVMPGLIYGPGDTSSVRATLLQYLQRKLPLLPAKTRRRFRGRTWMISPMGICLRWSRGRWVRAILSQGRRIR